MSCRSIFFFAFGVRLATDKSRQCVARPCQTNVKNDTRNLLQKYFAAFVGFWLVLRYIERDQINFTRFSLSIVSLQLITNFQHKTIIKSSLSFGYILKTFLKLNFANFSHDILIKCIRIENKKETVPDVCWTLDIDQAGVNSVFIITMFHNQEYSTITSRFTIIIQTKGNSTYPKFL